MLLVVKVNIAGCTIKLLYGEGVLYAVAAKHVSCIQDDDHTALAIFKPQRLT